jgi:hypothetical protein
MKKKKEEKEKEAKSNHFQDVFLERSALLHRFLKEHIFLPEQAITVTANPVDGMPMASSSSRLIPWITEFEETFGRHLARSTLFENSQRRLAFAHAFALGSTEGLGGDSFQRFIGTHCPWSMLTKDYANTKSKRVFKATHALQTASLAKMVDVWEVAQAMEFRALLLPVWSPLEGRAMLLFKWPEDDPLGNLQSQTLFYLGVIVTITNAKDVLATARLELESQPPTEQCECLPRSWLLAPKSNQRAVRESADHSGNVALSFETVEQMASRMQLHYQWACVIDSALLNKYDRE